MKRKLSFVGAALAISTVVSGGAAHAGATISDKRYWPDEASRSRLLETHLAHSVLNPGAAPLERRKQRKPDKTLK